MESENAQNASMPIDQAGTASGSSAPAAAPVKKKADKLTTLVIVIAIIGLFFFIGLPLLLGALFAVGVFSSSQPSSNSPTWSTNCIAAPGVLCNIISYSKVSGNLSFTFGQATGNNWNQIKFAFAPTNATVTNSTISSLFGAGNTNSVLNTLPSGGTANVTVSIGKTSKGSSISGYIFVMYQVAGYAIPQYLRVATVSVQES